MSHMGDVLVSTSNCPVSWSPAPKCPVPRSPLMSSRRSGWNLSSWLFASPLKVVIAHHVPKGN